MGSTWRSRAAVVGGLVTLLAVGGPRLAVADPVGAGTASSFALTASLAGTELIPATPTAEVASPPFGADQDSTAIPIDASPVAVNGTLIARAAVHEGSDIPTALEQSAQAVAGPYNAQGVGQIEDLEVLIDAVEVDVPLVEADLIRAEAVAVCTAGAVQYSASSEIVNLVIGGEDPLSGPLNDLIAQIEEALEPLAPLVDLKLNVVEQTATGVSVDALVLSVLSAVDPEAPVLELRFGHAEVSGVACGGGGGSGHVPQCSDTADNDGDGLIDALDPGCHTDGNPANPGSYDPNDDDETNTVVLGAQVPKAAAALPSTGGAVATGLALALGAGALGLLALRRRLT